MATDVTPTVETSFAPRGWYRHPADLARLLVALAVTVVVVLIVRLYPDRVVVVSRNLVDLVSNLPPWLSTVVIGLLQLLALAIPLAVLAVLVLRRRWSLLGLLALAGGATLGLILLAYRLFDEDAVEQVVANDHLGSWVTGRAFPSGTFVAVLTALVVASAPFVRRRWRRVEWCGIALLALLRLLTATEVPVNLTVAIALGFVGGSLALLVLGAPPQRVDPEVLTDALGRCGLEVTGVRPLSRDRGSPSVRVSTPSGDVYVRVLGREERDADLLLRWWNALWVKGLGDDRPAGSARRVAENAALAEALAGSGGARVPRVVAVTTTEEDGAALLADEYVGGVALSGMTAEEIGDDLLRDVWRQVAALHAHRIAHRWLDARHVSVVDGRAVIVDFRTAVLAARDELVATDVTELAASLSTIVGVERAVASARDVLSPEALAAAVPLMQPVVLRPATRAQFKARKGAIGELRQALADAAGVETVELAQIHRITLKGAVSLVGSAVLAYYLLGLLADWQDIWETLRSAEWSRIPAMLVLMVGSYVGGAISLMGAVVNRLPFGDTLEVMFGQSFLNRFTPANAGGMALRARYLQLAGTDLTVAAAAVGLTSAASGVIQVVLLVVFAFWGGATSAFGDITMPPLSRVLLLLVAIAAVVGMVILSSWGKRVVVPWVERTWDKAFGSFRDLGQRPGKVVELFGGALFAKLSTVTAFVVSVHAFGVDMSFARAGALYMVANTIGSAVPTPGGVGGIEAALTAALISAGVADATAASIVLFFRLFTFWLPTVPGWFFLQRVQRRGIV